MSRLAVVWIVWTAGLAFAGETTPVGRSGPVGSTQGHCDCRADVISEIDIRSCWKTCAADGLQGIRVSNRSPCGGWQTLPLASWKEQLEEEMRSRRVARLVVWVHGNRVDCQQARQRGMAVYRALSAQACGAAPIHFVILSWPSARTGGPIEDLRTKASRTERVAYKLAQVLAEMPAEAPVGLIGYSLGARISAAAAHLRLGGRLGRFTVAPGGRYRLVFMAAAIDCGGMLPGRRYGLAPAGAERLLLLNNRLDPALKRYWILEPQRRPEALGYRGIACPQRLATCVDQRDVSRLVGRTHSLDPYLAQCGLMRAAWQTLVEEGDSTLLADLE